jgi:hypothetical protein
MVGLIALAAACGGSKAQSGSPPKLGSMPANVDDLVTAQHAKCDTIGHLVEQYLLTGDNGGYPSLDQSYAGARSDLLQEPEAARGGTARADADDAIQYCDKQQSDRDAAASQAKADAEQAAAQAKADAEARAQAAAAAVAQASAYRSGCAAHHGYIADDGRCRVDYPGQPGNAVELNDDGTFDQADADLTKEDCANADQDWLTAQQEGVPMSGSEPVYHADTGVCVNP